jgi:hypothetical protein
MAVGGVAYAAGNSAAKSRAREEDQNAQLASLQAQAAQPQTQQPAQRSPQTAHSSAPPAAAPDMDTKIAQLQELAQLKTAGVLTDEEFAAQKARILAS